MRTSRLPPVDDFINVQLYITQAFKHSRWYNGKELLMYTAIPCGTFFFNTRLKQLEEKDGNGK